MKEFTTLKEMYESIDFQYFISDKLGNDLFINDPERAERIVEYAENGCDGSTHSEVINDWQDFIDTLKIFDPENNDIEDIQKFDITQENYNNICNEINSCEEYHYKRGTLDNIIN